MNLAETFKTKLNPLLLRRLGVAPAPRTRFLMGQRAALFERFHVDRVFDVGANEGQYGEELRRLGYAGRIHSFEPMGEAFEGLLKRSGADAGWDVYNTALGATASVAQMYAWSGHAGESSSLHEPVAELVNLLGKPRTEQVEVQSLDQWAAANGADDLESTWLKVDTQGSEAEVLAGAEHVLKRVAGVEIELPLRRWYEGAADFQTLMQLLMDSGLIPASIMTERFRVEWQGAIDVDALFVRRSGD